MAGMTHYRYTGKLFDKDNNFIAPKWVERAYHKRILYYENDQLLFDNGQEKVKVEKNDGITYIFKTGEIYLCKTR